MARAKKAQAKPAEEDAPEAPVTPPRPVRDAQIVASIATLTGEKTYHFTIPNHASNTLDRSPDRLAALIRASICKEFPTAVLNELLSGG